MNKLIKLSDTHYIVVDDSEIKENGVKCFVDGGLGRKGIDDFQVSISYSIKPLKITHSTKPLEMQKVNSLGSEFAFVKIKQLSLSKVEELTQGYSVEKMAAESALCNGGFIQTEDEYDVAISYYHQGFKACLELTKDKLFTVEDILNTYELGIEDSDNTRLFGKENVLNEFKSKIKQSLLPKTEWDVEIEPYYTDECERLEGTRDGENIKVTYKIKLI